MPKKIAVIDVGSNSSKALISYVNELGMVTKADEQSFPCRLISTIKDFSNKISQEDLSSLLETIGSLLQFCYDTSPDHVVIVATEAIRKSSNMFDIISAIKNAYSENLFVLTGEQEARFIARGLKCDPQFQRLPAIQAFDLGGGSLEFIQSQESQPIIAKSMELGALNVAKKYLIDKDVALSKESEDKLRLALREQFLNCGLSKGTKFELIGLGGAIFFLRKIICRTKGLVCIDEYNQFTVEEVALLANAICRMDLKERLVKFPDLPADRNDVFPVVCIIVEEIMRCLNKKSFCHSFYNLRYGVASWYGTSSDTSSFPD
jgi:exopolyphosphatase/guanosine-5'-triphosphate,3'-diphosphate pyrophosphatase